MNGNMNFEDTKDDSVVQSNYRIRKKEEELREWKDEMLIPLQLENERSLIVVEQMEAELDAYKQEVDKLKGENQVLSEAIQAVMQRSSSTLLQSKDRTLFQLDIRCKELESQAVTDKQRINELMRKNTALHETNEQYQVILDESQKEKSSSKDKLHQESKKFNLLQEKYSLLELEYHNTSSIAEDIQTELCVLKSSSQTDNIQEKNTYQGKPHGHFQQQTLQFPLDSNSDLEKVLYDHSYEPSGVSVNSTLRFYGDDAFEFSGDEEPLLKDAFENNTKLEISLLMGQIVKYKKQLVLKDIELKRLRTNDRSVKRSNIFGWGCC